MMLAALSAQLGVVLAPMSIDTKGGSSVQVDGFSKIPPVLCEAYAHHGGLKAGQKHKVVADAFKLLYAEKLLGVTARKIILLADEQAASPLRGRGWASSAFKLLGIEVQVVGIASELNESIRAAQVRQRR